MFPFSLGIFDQKKIRKRGQLNEVNHGILFDRRLGFHYFSVRYGVPLVRAQRLFYKFDIV